jgi:hypothetical protein
MVNSLLILAAIAIRGGTCINRAGTGPSFPGTCSRPENYGGTECHLLPASKQANTGRPMDREMP